MAVISSKETAKKDIREGDPKIHLWDDNLLHDKELLLEAMKVSGFYLWRVPADILDKDICLEAVRENGDALSDVPEKFRDIDVCAEALKGSLRAKRFIPDSVLVEAFVIASEARKEGAIHMVSQSYQRGSG